MATAPRWRDSDDDSVSTKEADGSVEPQLVHTAVIFTQQAEPHEATRSWDALDTLGLT